MNLELLPAFADGDVFHVVVESPRGSAPATIRPALRAIRTAVSRLKSLGSPNLRGQRLRHSSR
jgi:hypothetical protein